MKVAGWEVEAEMEMGRDDDSTYYLLNGNIYRKQESGTRWYCTKEAWEGCKKTYQIRSAEVTP